MRIISGKLKGRRFSAPKNFKARPTTDFAKENLFNILNNIVDYNKVSNALDLFSGTGSISYEFASRGVEKITCVEANFNHFKFIVKTVNDFDLKPIIKVVKGDAFKFITRSKEKYDIIFADPPYDLEKLETIPELIFKYNLLKDDGLLIFEHSEEFEFNDNAHYIETRKNGKVHFSFFR